ncbi:MAG TPA: M1 family aminopeptidase [Gaiellaceae bacterium]
MLGLTVLVTAVAPLNAGARPPLQAISIAAPSFSAAPQLFAGAHLVMSRLSSTRAGRAYRLHGTVLNLGGAAAHGRLVVHLLRVGSRPITVGRTSVMLGARDSAAYGLRIRLPHGLPNGSYALVGCVPREGSSGVLSCVTAEHHIQIGRAHQQQITALSAPPRNCSSGARSLSAFGSHVYPETGNGGYRSVHSDVFITYDADANLFLPGTHVVLTDQATQCLTDFSLDFERTSQNTKDGPNLTVASVRVNGQPASFTFVQPTYPGDPSGQNDPDPRAHEAGQLNPVGGPDNNPLPPACSPELLTTKATKTSSLDGTQCPANKLVITPASPIANGAAFTVQVSYTGRPGVHNDGDGTTEGWFRNNQGNDAGGFVTTEPVATEDWMPLDDFPSAKPTYDFYDTIATGKTAIANGELVSQTANLPDSNFAGGSTTWHWHSPEGVASYLVENSIGNFDLSERLASSGIQYYEAQDSAIPKSKAATNKAIEDMQEDIVNFQSMFNGTFPFTTDGVVIGLPAASFEEEMQTKITFAGGTIDLDTLNHENMHQWWGDNVSEASYNLTFFKEGLATLGEFLFGARNAQTAAGGPGTPAGDAAFEQSLVSGFDSFYASAGSFWTTAPSDPSPSTLFSGSSTYLRPGIAYIALRQILGASNFSAALQQIQQTYGQGSVTEAQLEAGFAAHLSNPACAPVLSQFFTEWFDTAYPAGDGANRPEITGPGLDGGGFPCS